MSYDWRARIGYITPSNTLETPAYEFYRMAPPGVALVGACLSVNRLTADAVDAALLKLDATARDVAEYSVDVLVVGGGPLVYLRADDNGDRILGRRVSDACGVPAFSEMTATVEALRSLGASNIAIASPFGAELNQPLTGFLERSGFVVKSVVGLGKGSNAEITRLPLHAAYSAARAAVRGTQSVDAVYITCPRWPVAPNIEPLEQDLGIPIVASVQSWIWAALRTVGVRSPISGYGRLLRESDLIPDLD
jgi:maleate isomerase